MNGRTGRSAALLGRSAALAALLGGASYAKTGAPASPVPLDPAEAKQYAALAALSERSGDRGLPREQSLRLMELHYRQQLPPEDARQLAELVVSADHARPGMEQRVKIIELVAKKNAGSLTRDGAVELAQIQVEEERALGAAGLPQQKQSRLRALLGMMGGRGCPFAALKRAGAKVGLPTRDGAGL